MAAKNGYNLLKQIIDISSKNTVAFESILSKVKPISSGNGYCKCEMRVEEEHQNRWGTLHGGMTCTLVDSVSTWALMASDKPATGVSVDLSVSFMKGAQIGSDIIIDAKTLKRGSRLAFLTVDIINKADGKLIAQGKHTKFVGDGRLAAMQKTSMKVFRIASSLLTAVMCILLSNVAVIRRFYCGVVEAQTSPLTLGNDVPQCPD